MDKACVPDKICEPMVSKKYSDDIQLDYCIANLRGLFPSSLNMMNKLIRIRDLETPSEHLIDYKNREWTVSITNKADKEYILLDFTIRVSDSIVGEALSLLKSQQAPIPSFIIAIDRKSWPRLCEEWME